jgi:hypothetical protein
MPAFNVELSHGIIPIFLTEGDLLPGRIKVQSAHIQQTATHILRELRNKFGQHKVRGLGDNEAPFPNDGILQSSVHRVSRHSNVFVGEFKGAVGKIVEELGAAVPGDGVLVLETSSNSETNFAGVENIWGDFVYVFARVIKKKG